MDELEEDDEVEKRRREASGEDEDELEELDVLAYRHDEYGIQSMQRKVVSHVPSST